MRSRLVLIGLVVALAVTVSAQQGAGGGRPLQGPNAIQGRVLDSAGKPVPGTRVTVLRPRPDRTPPYEPVNVQQVVSADENGFYRLGGLAFEEYLVLAMPRNAPLNEQRQLNRSGFANTFHPSTRLHGDAKLVRVTASGPVLADIVMVPATLAAVSGTVLNSKGDRVAAGQVNLAVGDGLFGLEGRNVIIQPNGLFVAPGLQPGTYFLQYRESAWPPPRGTIPLVSQVKVVVDGRDVTGVRVIPLSMTSVSGRLVLTQAVEKIDPSRVRVGGSPMSFDGNPGPQRGGEVRADMTFEFLAWPGPYRARVFVDGQEWVVTSIRWKGADITRTGIDVEMGKPVTGVEVGAERRRR